MCSYTQVVIVTHRSPVIPCQRLMFRSSQVIFLFFFQLHTARGFLSLLCVFAVLLCSQKFCEPLVLNNINRSTAFCNPFGNSASQLVTGRFTHCEVRVVWRIPLELSSPTNAFATVKR